MNKPFCDACGEEILPYHEGRGNEIYNTGIYDISIDYPTGGVWKFQLCEKCFEIWKSKIPYDLKALREYNDNVWVTTEEKEKERVKKE